MVGQVIRTDRAHRSPLYPQAVRAGDFVFVSGTVGIDPSTGDLAGPTVQEQTRQALVNCRHILEAAGADLGDVVDVHRLLWDPDDADAYNEVFRTFFPDELPARSGGRLGANIPGLLVSVKMVAYTGPSTP